MSEIESYSEWEGAGEELARTGGELLGSLGLVHDADGLNVRLIRDYVQRGIVSKPERRGKEAFYGFRQLIELVAARVLVADGWPLAKIAEQFFHASDDELRRLIPGEERENVALDLARRLRSESLSTAQSSSLDQTLLSNMSPPITDQLAAPAGEPGFRRRAARLSGMQMELRESLRRLGLPADRPPVEQVTIIAIAPWCQFLIETDRFSRITVEEAEEIGRAITASLLNPSIRKGTK